MKGSPVVGNQQTSFEKPEELQCIFRREMTPSKTRLPPGRVTNRKQRDIELAASLVEMPLDQVMRIANESCVASEKSAPMAIIQQVHIRRCTPAIEAIAVAPVTRRSSKQRHSANSHFFVRSDRDSMTVPPLLKPPLYSRRGIQWNVARQSIECCKREVIGVSVG